MKLAQHPTFKNFYEVKDSGFFVFSRDTTKDKFDLEQAFTSYTFEFFLIFYKNKESKISADLNRKISSGDVARRIYWIDDIDSDFDLNFCPFLGIKDKNVVNIFSGTKFGNYQNRIVLKNDDNNSTISFKKNGGFLQFDVIGSDTNTLTSVQGDVKLINEFNQFIIPLTGQEQLFGMTPADRANTGFICFKSLPSTKGSVQPASTLLTEANNEVIEHSFRLFEDVSYSKSTELLGSFYPALDFSNSHRNFVPRLEVFFKGEINSNILDEFGNNFMVSSSELKPLLINELAYTNSDKDDDYSTRNFCFIPKHLSRLELVSKGQQMLLGNSGSERQSKTALVFYNVEEVLYKELESGQIEVKAHGQSRTSLALSPDKEEKAYFVDSERFPSFKNQAISGYEAIDVGVIKNDVAGKRIFPIIPILCFSGNDKLEELENVLVKHRLTNSKKIDAASRVTPNGFLKSGGQLNFINNKKQNLKASFDNASAETEVNYRFTINLNNPDVKTNLDFNTSITKEDVFFVTTPKLLKETADFHKHFDIFFGMHGFDIDLILGGSSSFEHKDRIIVFKYSRYSVDELIEDTSNWSNFGKFKRDLPALQSALKNEFQNFELEYNGGENPDYEYIDQVVRRDRNWNGIFILNIPISNSEHLPDIFTGLISSQSLAPYPNPQNPDNSDKRQFKVGLKFQYVAFPVNKTEIGSGNAIQIKSTSFYGLIDYDLLKKRRDGDLTDITTVKAFFPKDIDKQKKYRFLLTKLLVRFENSEIRHFQSFAFLQTPALFEDTVKFDGTSVTHDDSNPDPVKNLIRLEGNYQKNSGGGDEFSFTAKSEITYIFPPGKILKDITLKSLSFHFSGGKNYRFNIDAEVHFNKFGLEDIFNISKINFRNIGLSFNINDSSITFPDFDLSSLGVFPDIDFDGKGFLSSFPIKFNSFKTFEMLKIGSPGNFKLEFPRYDFFNLISPKLPNVNTEWLDNLNNKFAPLFSFIFDFDLGTLGNLGGLKGIKAQLLVGWSFNGGFALGLKIGGASIEKLHLDLFGALKIDISKLELCKIKEQYVIRILDLRLEAMGIKLPLKEKEVLNGLIFANTKPGKDKKTGWLITYISHIYDPIENKDNPLLLGIGQRVTIKDIENLHLVEEAILKVKQIFNPKTQLCGGETSTIPDVYSPKNNWLIASERFIPKAWRSIFDVKFIFNDPTLYGLQVHLIKYFKIDILYKKISDELGVYSTELELAPSLRNIDLGGAALTLPNVGLDVYTNGDFMIDVGYPRSSDDWSRSILLQIRPFLGFAGIKGGRLRTASLSLFDKYKDEIPAGCNIIQGGIALRVGLGAYIDKGIFYAGASVTVYGILDGALAFNPGEQGIKRVFPDHFALFGRIGAMVEIVGAVDFKVVKAAVHVILRVEFGVLLAVINGKLKPVPVYIEGEVKVSITFTIACFRVFRSRVCITIRLSFHAYVRFPYTFGGDSSKRWALEPGFGTNFLDKALVEFGEIPVLYVPGVTKTADGNKLVHQFVINFFASNVVKDGDNFKAELPKFNVLKDSIVKPIFEAIYIAADKSVALPYSFLRSMFIEGKNAVPPPFKLDFSKYKPTILAGYKWDVDADREFLKSIFLLSDAEVTTFATLINSAPCKPSDSEKCPFRPIPVPINSSLKVKEKGKEPFETTNKGFTIKITDLFKNPDGTEPVEKIIEEAEKDSENAYSSKDLEFIDSYFDSYVTQYLDRKSPATLEVPVKDQDIRRDAIIPEYFKLIGLLFLESCYNKFLNQADKSDPKTIDPSVSLEFTDAGSGKKDFVVMFSYGEGKTPVKIKPNDVLPDLVGQLNYFYNNGLRLPDVLKNPNDTKAYFDLIGQTSDLKSGKINVSAAADIKIVKRDNSAFVSLKDELFSGDGLKDFVDTANKILEASTGDLKNQILSVKSEDPYEFVNVKLGILNSLVGTKDKGHRFFEVPDRIHRNLGGIKNKNEQYKKLVFNLRSEGETKAAVDYAACINVQVKVKPHFQSDNKCRVLELVNVNVDDLELMHKIKSLSDYAFIEKISLYLKSDSDLIPLKLSEEIKTQPSLVKTNLSPKTHPPVIDIARASFASEAEKYIAMMNNFPDFSRILWEAVTTNHGGFYLVESKDADVFSANFKKPSSIDDVQEYTIVFSFESKADEPVYAFSNYFKVHKDSLNFDLLDKDKIRLYTKVYYDKVIRTDREGKSVYQPVEEYHSKIPAHCFSFNVKRKPPKANSGLEQYIPLEFGITKKDGTPIVDQGGNAILTRDKILPLMPKNELDEKGDPIDTEWNYNHVSPMSTQTEKNLDRYALVGESFKVNFSIRDAFGFRIIESDKSLTHTQKYFDKLIPLNSWPCITLNYWFDKYLSPDNLQFNLSLSLFENKDLGLFKDSETADPLESIKKNLYTILAQLKDRRMHAEIVCEGNEPVSILKELSEAVQTVINNLDKPDDITAEVLKPKLIPFSVKTDKQFKCELNPQIVIERRVVNDQDDVFIPIDKNIWDSDLVRKTVAPLALLAPKKGSAEENKPDAPQENAVQVLNKLVSAGKYRVGISVKNDRRIIYLINSEYLTMSPVETSPLSRGDSYFAVKPYSNKLWSGSYKPMVDGLSKRSYTGIDLDKGLNTILSKVDELLSPDKIKELIFKNNPEGLNYAELLVQSKKLLVENELKGKTANIDDPKSTIPELTKEFRSLMLERLDYFYQYDGIVKLTLPNRPELKDHRLFISVKEVDIVPIEEVGKDKIRYNLTSSKIHFKDGEFVKWFVLFDQIGIDQWIDLEIKPSVTHIEFDIEEMGSEIQKSTWIKLIEPHELLPNGKTISTIHPDTDENKKWPRIFREFPVKPSVLRHEAKQRDGFNPAEVSSIEELGNWEYALTLKGDFKPETDRLDFKIKVKEFPAPSGSFGESESRTFSGFIAYWSDMISKPGFNSDLFIDDLYKVLNPAPAFESITPPKYKYYTFITEASKQDGKFVWNIKKDDREPDSFPKFQISIEQNADLLNLKFSQKGFNIFKAEPEKICSVLPEVIQKRNYRAKNDDFVYTTDMVSPASWATPHIKFFDPIRINGEKPFKEIFKTLKEMQLPYKSTSKLLVNSSEDLIAATAKLPVISITQMEFTAGSYPGIQEFDDVFKPYKNGNPALSVTVYNESHGANAENDLPVFFANSIYKKK